MSMDALSKWAAFAGILSRGPLGDGYTYDAHVGVLLDAIEGLSDAAKAELNANLEAP